MNIGELFVNLGIKGSEKTLSALSATRKGMGDLKTMSLETKAGLVAAMYALERLFATSGQAGTGLTNFNALLGVSAKTLQQYQYAARQMGVSNQEVEGSFKALQATMAKTLMGKGAPEGMQRLAQLTGGITPQEIEQMAKTPELLMQRLQQYAKRETNAGLRNEVLKSFNISDNMISAMVRGAFRPDVLKKAPIYSDKEIGALDKANIAWGNLGNKIEMAIGHFNARHGVQLVSDISKITDKVLKLVEAFTTLAEKLKIFSLIGKSLEGLTLLFDKIGESVTGITKDKGGILKGMVSEGKEIGKGMGLAAKGAMITLMEAVKPKAAPGALPSGVTKPSPAIPFKEIITPKIPMQSPSGKTQNINIKQDLHFQHEGKDHARTSDSVKKANQEAFRQFPQGQVT